MGSIGSSYPGFHALPRGIKQLLLTSENHFFNEASAVRARPATPSAPRLKPASPPSPLPEMPGVIWDDSTNRPWMPPVPPPTSSQIEPRI